MICLLSSVLLQACSSISIWFGYRFSEKIPDEKDSSRERYPDLEEV